MSEVAVVTGASRGLGRFLADWLEGRGYRVAGCSRAEADVTQEEQVARFVRGLGGRLDVLLNCAGCASMNHSLLTPAASVLRMLEVNTVGTFLMTREAAKVMRRHGFGRVVNFSSVAVPLALEGQAGYVASKGAVEALTRTMARELAGMGITVNCVGVTPLDTDMTRGVPPETMERLVASLPVSRMGTFEDVANVVDFFLRPESAAVTGQVLYLGGV